MTPRRALGYARVSSVQQAYGPSLDDQQRAIRSYAEQRGVPLHRMYVEAESGGKRGEERRAQMHALLAEVRRGDLVLCDKLDRWSRNPEFTYSTIRQILEKGASFYAVGDQCDPSTNEGDTMLNFRVLFAREEHKRILTRLIGTRNKMRERGLYVDGQPPLGYRRERNVGTEAERHRLVHDRYAEVVRRIFDLCVQGWSLTRIARETERDRSVVHRVLRCRHYLGEVRDGKGGWQRGVHPPLVTVATWTKAQAALDARLVGGVRPRSGDTRTSTWILRNVATCARCGARMTSAWNSSGTDYYRCAGACRGGYVRVVDAEDAAGPPILARLVELREEIGRGPKAPPSGSRTLDLEEQRERIVQRRARVMELFEMGDLAREELRSRMARLDADLARIEAEDEAHRPSRALATPKARRAALKAVGAIERAWAKAPPKTRRLIVEQLATRVAIAVHETPVFEWRSIDEMLTNQG